MAKKPSTDEFATDETPDFTDAELAFIDTRISKSVADAFTSVVASDPSAGDLFILKYRQGQIGVQTGFIRATSPAKAEAVGHAYCDSIPGCRYVHVAKAIIANESILTKASIREELAVASGA